MYLQFLFFLLLGFISSLLSFPEKPPPVPPKEGDEGEFFWRPATREVVNLMAKSINKSVNPCDDFYEFACGKQRSNPVSLLSRMSTSYNQDVTNFMINEMKKIVDSKAVNATKVILRSCTNYEQKEPKDIYNILHKKFSKHSIKELFTELMNYDWQTSFKTFPFSDEHGYGIAIGPVKDGFTTTPLADVNVMIDKMFPNNSKLANGVKEYTKGLLTISDESADGDEVSSYIPISIDIEGIRKAFGTRVSYNVFIERLDKLIIWTGAEVVRAHALMRVALTLDADQIHTDFFEFLFREQFWAQSIAQQLSHVVASAIAKDQLPMELKSEVKDIFENVMDSLEKVLKRQKWMGNSKQPTINKTREVEHWIGIPESFKDYSDLDLTYQGLKVDDGGDFLDHLIALSRFRQTEKVAAVKSRRNLLLYISKQKMLSLNAINWVHQDLTLFTIGILQSPFFYYRFPEFYRYGLLGFVFGHEYGHGLAWNGTLGPYFGSNETISQSTKDEFARRKECFIDEFNKERVLINGTRYEVSGERTFDENIADNSAYRTAFKAYKKLMKKIRRPKLLREFKDYTSNQMFFISTAQFFCSSDAREYEKLEVGQDPHAPNAVRVNAVKNSDDFAKAFKCPVGSKMNPQKKCRLWD